MRVIGKVRHIIMAIFLMSVCLIIIGSYNYGREVNSVYAYDYPHVLVINAYHQGFGWTDDQTEAIINRINEQNSDAIVSVEYLDWKRFPHEENLKQQFNYFKYKYSSEDIDVVIATDDIGMQFAIDYRSDLFADAAIVFTAVMEESALSRSEGVSNITGGVYEGVDAKGTIESILGIHPNIEHIYIVSDASESSVDLYRELIDAIDKQDESSDIISYQVLSDYSYDDIKYILSNPLDHSVVIMGSFTMDTEGKSIPTELFTKELSDVIDMPIYSLYEYLLGHGIIGGSLLSGSLQGQVGADIALRILDGESADSIPFYNEKKPFIVALIIT